jgi:hypothetical protein
VFSTVGPCCGRNQSSQSRERGRVLLWQHSRLVRSTLRSRFPAPARRAPRQGDLLHLDQQDLPGTVRDYWVYSPAGYTPDKPACVMVFQDGEGFIKEDGRARIPIVFEYRAVGWDALARPDGRPVTTFPQSDEANHEQRVSHQEL